MKVGILTASVVFMVSGLVIGLLSNKHRNPGAPTIPSFNPAHWVQPWKIPEWFTPTGMKYFYSGNVCLMVGIALYILAEGLPSIFD